MCQCKHCTDYAKLSRFTKFFDVGITLPDFQMGKQRPWRVCCPVWDPRATTFSCLLHPFLGRPCRRHLSIICASDTGNVSLLLHALEPICWDVTFPVQDSLRGRSPLISCLQDWSTPMAFSARQLSRQLQIVQEMWECLVEKKEHQVMANLSVFCENSRKEATEGATLSASFIWTTWPANVLLMGYTWRQLEGIPRSHLERCSKCQTSAEEFLLTACLRIPNWVYLEIMKWDVGTRSLLSWAAAPLVRGGGQQVSELDGNFKWDTMTGLLLFLSCPCSLLEPKCCGNAQKGTT